MANSETIKEFLVSVAFGVDKNSEKRADNSIKSFTKGLENLAKVAAAAGVATFITKTAAALEKLYYQSQRIKSSTVNINSFQDAVQSLGGSAEEALGSMEAMAKNLRNGPGFYGMLEDIGVKTKDVNGKIRDQVDLMSDLGKKFADMPHYQANSYANALGIDEKTMMAMKDGRFVENLRRYNNLRKQMGLSDKDAKVGQEFTQQLRDTSMIVGIVLEKLAVTMMKVVLPPIKFVNNQFERLLEWFSSLPEETKEVIKAFVKVVLVLTSFQAILALALPAVKGLTVAIRLLNLSFLMSPIGIILALAAAIALLWEDYKVWKEGGQSLINWGKWEPEITAARNGIDSVTSAIGRLGRAVYEFVEKHSPKVAETMGEWAAVIAAAFGNDDAAEALRINANAKANGGVYNPKDANPEPLNKPKRVNGKAAKGNGEFLGGNIKGFNDKETESLAKTMAQRESGGRLSVVNKWGYTGQYQFGASALAETGFINPKKLKNAPKGVKNGSNASAHRAFLADKSNWLVGDWDTYKNSKEMQDLSFRKLFEKNLGYGEGVHKGDKRKMAGYGFAAHLKGAGAAKNWYQYGKDSKDGLGTNTSSYAIMGEKAINSGKKSSTLNLSSANLNLMNNALKNSNMVTGLPPSLIPNTANTTSNNINVSPTTNITVNGVNNPQEAATIAANRVDDTYSQLTRSLQVSYS